jgi:hypothetical protein
MYGESKITTNVTLTAPTTFATAQAQVAVGGSLRFSVEEEEMFTTLEFQGVCAHSVADTPFDATFFVDGVDAGELVDGIQRFVSNATPALPVPVYFKLTKRLTPGEHRVEVRFKSAAGNVLVQGLLHPAKLSATRLSSNATVAANMTSKQVTGVY